MAPSTLPPFPSRLRLRCIPWALLVIGIAACSSSREPLSIRYDLAPPGIVPAISLAGRQGTACVDDRRIRRGTAAWLVGESFRLETDPERIARAIETGGVGHPVVHYFACERFEIELTVVLEGGTAGDAGHARRTMAWLATLFPDALYEGALWTLANRLRIDPDRPFVYGANLWGEGDETISVLFDPNDPIDRNARLVVVYRRGL